jgi:hypothetical protein
MGDQRRRSRSGYITGYRSPLGVAKSEDALPINQALGYEPSQGRLTCPDWMHWNWSVRVLEPASSALSQPRRLVAQRLVTAAVTKHGSYSPVCSRPGRSQDRAGGGKNVAVSDRRAKIFRRNRGSLLRLPTRPEH